MKNLTSNQVRQLFLEFFKENGHKVEPGASLIPQDDPTLLWINSGVATLKKYFDGSVIPDNRRIVNCQKSIRTNDIENVGYTARHHTFFEMLGNFSIGDYFKKEAIQLAWSFLTDEQWLGFDKSLLSVTVHPEDDEAYDIWAHEIKLPEERLIRLEENFWDIGVGPSGPNTEIFYDRGPDYGNDPTDPELYPGGENERYLEIWNLVFSEYNHQPDHTYTLLPSKNIDTGMGLERIVSIIQNTPTNFETDLFMPLIKSVEKLSTATYGENEAADTAFKVIADHIRTVVFAIGDGALPSNEGRGYVLRRLLRRAVRYAKQIGIEQTFMPDLVQTIGDMMADFYPNILKQADYIKKVIKMEEDRFHETLNDGLSMLENIIEREKANNSTVFPGSEVFKLYDTYGFPKELTEEYLADHGFSIDEVGFEAEMHQQQERARKARKNVESMHVQGEALAQIKSDSTFVGYEQFKVTATILAVVKDDTFVDAAELGDDVFILLDKTPFYAESGGQVSDIGSIYGTDGRAYVKEVSKAPKGQHLHYVTIDSGLFTVGQDVTAEIDTTRRRGIIKNHTVTHLLHQALRDTLGTHVSQAGSLVTYDRLRFDFTHFGAVTIDELKQIEQQVNEKIWQALNVVIEHKSLDEAKTIGAMALFGEKYGDVVRVVQVGDYSIELCGGCHVANTSEIGLFKIVSESGIGAGTRRIEAVTSREAYELLSDEIDVLQHAAQQLKTSKDQVPKRIDDLHNEMNDLKKVNESLSTKLAQSATSTLVDNKKTIQDVDVLAQEVDVNNMKDLRSMMDEMRKKLTSGIILLAAEKDGKVLLVASVSQDLVSKGLHAGHLIKEVAQICGGGGGGRPDMAQAGGKDPAKIQDALQFVETYIENQTNNK